MDRTDKGALLICGSLILAMLIMGYIFNPDFQKFQRQRRKECLEGHRIFAVCRLNSLERIWNDPDQWVEEVCQECGYLDNRSAYDCPCGLGAMIISSEHYDENGALVE